MTDRVFAREPSSRSSRSSACPVLACAAALGMLACSNGGGSSTACGQGTTLVGTQCVPLASVLGDAGGPSTRCGPGTVLAGTTCVLAPADGGVTCGPGTVLSGRQCVLGGTGVTCGAGTTLKGGACVVVDAGVTCGPGTALDGGVCVPVRVADGGKGDAAPAVGRLTLTLSTDPWYNGGDTVKLFAITAADLLDATGKKLASATIASGQAVFDLTGVGAGDAFIEVNGYADDLVPTRIDDPSANLDQVVGADLRLSAIGPPDTPTYRVKTWSAGQNEAPVVKWSDGTPVGTEHPYVILTPATSKFEARVLGTAEPLVSFTGTSNAHPDGQAFVWWVLWAAGAPNHGDTYKVDGGETTCLSCHMSLATKPAAYTSVSTTSGWCYYCHYGTIGDNGGFIDTTK